MVCVSSPGLSAQIERYPVPALPHRAVIDDFNGNGWPDIAVVSKYSDVTIFFDPGSRNGNRTLTLKAYFQPISLSVGDFNADGINDLIPITETLIGPFFLADGKGNFQKIDLKLYTPPFASFIEAGDLNNDKFDDLVVTGIGGAGPYVYINKQNGSFETIMVPLKGEEGKIKAGKPDDIKNVRVVSHHLTLIDLTSDGSKDILVPDELRGSLWLIQNKGKTFEPVEIFHEENTIAKTVASYRSKNAIIIILVLQKAQGMELVFMEGNSWPFPITKRIQLPNFISHLEIADMDNDGYPEILCLLQKNSRSFISLYMYNNFNAPVYEFPVSGPLSFAVADIDRDGFNDIIIPDYSENTLSIVYSPLKKK